jgi:hypothetical protein
MYLGHFSVAKSQRKIRNSQPHRQSYWLKSETFTQLGSLPFREMPAMCRRYFEYRGECGSLDHMLGAVVKITLIQITLVLNLRAEFRILVTCDQVDFTTQLPSRPKIGHIVLGWVESLIVLH